MITIFIDRKNKLTITCKDKSIVKYIPTKDQRSFVNEMFAKSTLMCTDEEGNEHKIPVLIKNNITGITTTLHTKDLRFDDYYAGVPKGTRYIPNKMVTFEKEKDAWLLERVKRVFNSYDNQSITERDFKIEMRKLL
jgi:hypothetical protein